MIFFFECGTTKINQADVRIFQYPFLFNAATLTRKREILYLIKAETTTYLSWCLTGHGVV